MFVVTSQDFSTLIDSIAQLFFPSYSNLKIIVRSIGSRKFIVYKFQKSILCDCLDDTPHRV